MIGVKRKKRTPVKRMAKTTEENILTMRRNLIFHKTIKAWTKKALLLYEFILTLCNFTLSLTCYDFGTLFKLSKCKQIFMVLKKQ